MESSLQIGSRAWFGFGKNIRKTGFPGHVTLTYAEGGQLVTSMGHWIELTRINTSVESVARCAHHNFGMAEATQYRNEIAMSRNETEVEQTVQRWSHRLVSQSAPTRM